MQTYEILVKNRAVVGNSRDMTLVRTSVGIDQAHILFDNPEWLDFPITITFSHGDVKITKSLIVSGVDSPDWVAEATCDIPWEVVETTGPIRVTLQGTDSSGNHIITAKGAPLSVEEAGDVIEGDAPADAPSVDDWHQAMADAMRTVNEAATLVNTLQSRLDEMVAEAARSIGEYVLPIASSSELGGIKIGDGLSISDDGVLSIVPSQESPSGESSGLTDTERSVLRNLQLLASYAFDTDFVGGVLQNTVTVKHTAMPLAKLTTVGAVRVDDETIKVSPNGTISSPAYELPIAATDVLGGVMIDGETILSNDGVVSVATADARTLGVVKPDGSTITIDQDGVITASGGGADGYILPKASISQLGGVMVDGETIGIRDGVIYLITKDATSEEY